MHDPFFDQNLIGKLKWIRDENKLRILSGQRVGWEQKTEIMHELAEMSAEGYLSQEEWEIRKKHVENAQTQDHLDLAMQDLQDARKNLAAVRARRERVAKERRELASLTEAVKPVKSSLWSSPAFYFFMWIASMIAAWENFALHDLVFFGVSLVSFTIWSGLLVARMIKGNGT